MRGIVLSGGSGSRLWPITKSVNKHLLHVYDKPMIYYPIATLMAAGIRDMLIISTLEQINLFKKLLGNGDQIGVNFSYEIQDSPKGIGEAFQIAEIFLQGEKSVLILGDNVFHGTGLGRRLTDFTNVEGAAIFGYQVSDPENYGVIDFGSDNKVISITEKPKVTKSNYAIPGIYFFDEKVVSFSKRIKPSSRGELEITDLLKMYLAVESLKVSLLPRGTVWLDTGTVDGLFDASNYIKIIEQRQGLKIGCIEEIAWRQGWISTEALIKIADSNPNSTYYAYLKTLPLLLNEM